MGSAGLARSRDSARTCRDHHKTLTFSRTGGAPLSRRSNRTGRTSLIGSGLSEDYASAGKCGEKFRRLFCHDVLLRESHSLETDQSACNGRAMRAANTYGLGLAPSPSTATKSSLPMDASSA